MTVATRITVCRILMVPVFAVLAVGYGNSTAMGVPVPALRHWALAVFILAAVSDGIDGWIARRFHQTSKLGAMLDPIADKLLMAAGVVILSAFDWGRSGWHLPAWFAAIVVVRDVVIVGGIGVLWSQRRDVAFAPHWVGKVTTVTQMIALGWVMLGWVDWPPAWTSAVAGLFTIWSAVIYVRQGIRILGNR